MADDGANLSFMGILKKIYSSYLTQTPPKSRVLDTGALAAALTAVIVMLYSVVVGTHFPFNAFLAALFSCLGSAVLISKCERGKIICIHSTHACILRGNDLFGVCQWLCLYWLITL